MTPTEKMIEAQRQRSAAYKEADDFYNQQNAYAVEISNLRKQVGLTQKQLAERIGVPQSTIALGVRRQQYYHEKYGKDCPCGS